jgi:hypothetical protein
MTLMCLKHLFQVKRQALILGVSVIFPLLLSTFGFHIILGILGVSAYLTFLIYSLVKKRPETQSSMHQIIESTDIEMGSKSMYIPPSNN